MTVAQSVARAVASPVARAVVSGIGGSGYDADVLDYFTRVEAAGGSFDLTGTVAEYTEEYSKNVWNTAIKALKGQNTTLNPTNLDVWSKIYEFNAHFGVTQAGHLQKIKYNAANDPALTDVSVSGYIPAGPAAGASGRMNSDTLGTEIGATCFLFAYITSPHTFGSGRTTYDLDAVSPANRPMLYNNAVGGMQGVYAAGFTSFSGDTGLILLNQSDLWRNGIKGGVSGGVLIPNANPIVVQRSAVGQKIIFSGCGSQKMTDAEAVVFSNVLNWVATQFGSNTY